MITEAMLCEAAHKASEVYTAYCERDYDPEKQYVLPIEFEKKIERLKRRADHPVFYKAMRRVASIALAFLIAGGAWIAVDTEARAAVVGWVKEIYETYFVYHFEGSSSKTETPVAYRLTLIPDGYTELFSDSLNDTVHVVYTNEKGEMLKFNYAVNPDETFWFIAEEQMVVEEITVNGVPADLITSTEPDAASAIVWIADNNTAFNVSGFFDVEDLIAIAESVQPIIIDGKIADADTGSDTADYRPTWLPDGYAEFYCDDSEDTIFVAYSNDDGQMMNFSYVHEADETKWFIDRNNALVTQVKVNDCAAELFISTDPDNANAIVWSNAENTAFYLSAFVDEAELIQIAESVQPKTNNDRIVDVASEPAVYRLEWIPDDYTEIYADDD